MTQRSVSFLTPGRMVLISILVTILIGTLILSLPCSQKTPLSLIDLLFTAISATTVTGLLTVPMESFTTFGQATILVLIQIGGLGLITLSIFLMSFFVELGLSAQLIAGQVLELEGFRGTRKLIKFIVGLTLFCEILGAFITWCSLSSEYTGPLRIFYSLFHSISSFCNAGFSPFPHGMEAFKTNIPFLLTTLLLVTIGGFGFLSLHELGVYVRSLKNKRRIRLSLHTQVIITTTLLITLITTILFWLLEYGHTLQGIPNMTTAVNVLFDAVCARSAGFTTFDVSTLRLATIFIIMIVAFIGSSPGSTGSGVKTTTFAVFMATIKAVISGRMVVELKERKIPNDQVFKALAVFLLSLTWISLAIFGLLLTEEGWHFLDVVFESFSAFTNLGLTTGITPYLSAEGKIYIMLIMIIGRIGSITLLIALRRRLEAADFRYPEERIMLS